MTSIREHTIVGLGDASYYVGGRVEHTLPHECDTGGSIVPAVVLHTEDQDITADLFRSEFNRYDEEDDVYQHHFSKNGVVFLVSHRDEDPSPTLPEPVVQFLSSLSSTLFLLDGRRVSLRDGPYFLRGRSLFEAWRLYPDTNEVFTLPVISARGGHPYTFEPLGLADPSGLYRAIAVPSRLYSPPTPARPLNGLRITVKDNYHLAGVHSTLGSRSWTKLYGAQDSTAPFVRQLVDLGAVIVGKTKMGAYAGSEVPPEKTIDYLAPWNPRADGYQGPSGSSSGAGASVASYEWIDLALGTDTTGSIRMPAASYGLWGLRSTWGSWSLEGVMAGVPAFDTVGALARSPDILKQVLLSRSTTGRIIKPRSLLIPIDWFPMSNVEQQRIVDSFVNILEAYLQIPTMKISLEEEWSRSGPADLRSKTLEQFLDKSIYWPNYYDGYHSYDTFRQEFQRKYGFPPYTSPFMTKRWALCDDISKEQRDQGFREIDVYYTWIRDHVLKEGLEDNIMVLPLGRSGANYRDVVPQPGGEFSTSAYDPMDLATVLGLPHLVIPVGQNPFESKVTKRTEYVPIVASLTGPRGSDESLIRIAEEAMKNAGWETNVLCGVSAFEVGSNERNAK
ncbi:putative amidase [Rosellinia necatrix]|uniref:Putative amidase n=1 Tax=Rosellinia necatrix TaxID=77044 RepID=A0A1W2TUC4_ROSNE|nr:putative amidase [Rosellinia necatrix]